MFCCRADELWHKHFLKVSLGAEYLTMEKETSQAAHGISPQGDHIAYTRH